MYIFWFLHQTTTPHGLTLALPKLYIFWFLHQTTTLLWNSVTINQLYIFWFLHQTTTAILSYNVLRGCISFDSYIKPQLINFFIMIFFVVYLLIPTSNHNYMIISLPLSIVVYLLIPTSNHNALWLVVYSVLLYIFWFLHQTTTCAAHQRSDDRCISFDSYIKPQLVDSYKN